jgi:hypothetical protein
MSGVRTACCWCSRRIQRASMADPFFFHIGRYYFVLRVREWVRTPASLVRG